MSSFSLLFIFSLLFMGFSYWWVRKPLPKIALQDGVTICEVSQLPSDAYEILFESAPRMYAVASTTNHGTQQHVYFVHTDDLPKDPNGKLLEYFIKEEGKKPY